MTINSDALFTNVKSTAGIGRIIQFPITRIFIAIIFLAPVSILSIFFGPEFFRAIPEPYFSMASYARDAGFLILFILAYQLYVRVIEKRDAYEFGGEKALGEFLIGCLMAIAIVCFMVGLMAISGYYKIDHVNSINIVIKGFFLRGWRRSLKS